MSAATVYATKQGVVAAPLDWSCFYGSDQHAHLSAPSLPKHIGEDGMHISRGTYARKNRGNSRNVLWSNRDTAEKCRDVCNATYDGDRSKAKAAAEDSGQSPRAAENWIAGDNPMSLTAFLNAYHNNPTFKAWAKKILLMEEDTDPEFQAQLALFLAAAQKAVSK